MAVFCPIIGTSALNYEFLLRQRCEYSLRLPKKEIFKRARYFLTRVLQFSVKNTYFSTELKGKRNYGNSS